MGEAFAVCCRSISLGGSRSFLSRKARGRITGSLITLITWQARAPVASSPRASRSACRLPEILDFYVRNGAAMFDKASIMQRLRYEYNSEPLAKQLKRVFGEDTTLGAKELECLLLLVMRNATTDSPWPLSNNPFAKYNDPAHPACNTKLPLWQLVRASTAAPTYFPPEVIRCGGKSFIFVDGGVTMYNNPTFQMFLMATVDRY